MFSRPASRDLLISLLTAVLRPAEPIVDVTVQNPELPRGQLADKDVFLDLVVRLGDGTLVDVEMQTRARGGATERALYYWARLASAELHSAEPYANLHRVAVVLLLGYRSAAPSRFHGVYQVRERTDGTLFSDRLELHTIELPRLAELAPSERAAEELLARWASFFNARDMQELQKLATMDPIMERAKSILEELSGEPSAQEAARQREIGWFNWANERYLERKAGREEGEANACAALRQEILAALDAGGISLSEAHRQQLEACSDIVQLARWLRQAPLATSADEAFAH